MALTERQKQLLELQQKELDYEIEEYEKSIKQKIIAKNKLLGVVQNMSVLLKRDDLPRADFLLTRTAIDTCVGGFTKRSINVILGPSGMGKSLVALHMAALMSRDYKVLYLSLENDITDDLERYNEMPIEYQKNDENLDFYSQQLSDLEPKLLMQYLTNCVSSNLYDIIFIDAVELMISAKSEGGAMYKSGMDFMERLKKSLDKSNTTVVLTWQTNRNGLNQTIEQLSLDDTAMSTGLVKFPRSIWCVGEDKNGIKKLRKLKYRGKVLENRLSTFAITDVNNINLCYDSIKMIEDMLPAKEVKIAKKGK